MKIKVMWTGNSVYLHKELYHFWLQTEVLEFSTEQTYMYFPTISLSYSMWIFIISSSLIKQTMQFEIAQVEIGAGLLIAPDNWMHWISD